MDSDTCGFDTIFCAAIGIASAEDRAAYIASACRDDRDLHAQVERLVSAHFRAGDFLALPATGLLTTVGEPMREGPGTIIGPYKLLEQIGEGGFGVVYMAEQSQPLRRKVALKILKPGMDTRQVVVRFEVERQALALMDHPNIAHVFDGGATASGRPYFVMELVRGIPITDYCDRNNLPIPERLKLFASVCVAVQHAHQKGIIHRDLKPSNLLVTDLDGVPVVKVIDFGIAKAMGQQLTEKTLFTSLAQMIGTPLYMSPEQAQMSGLDTDTRSDVYSLGVLLYELLTGTTPVEKERFGATAYDEIRRIIREEDPPTPSARLSTLGPAAATASSHRKSDPRRLSLLFRGELDWIVMKALEKDRNRRYESASAFAADVQRYLQNDSVQACPPSTWYRFHKFGRRNKRTIAMASVLAVAALVVTGGLAGSIGWSARDRAAQRRARIGEADFAVNQAAHLLEKGKASEATGWSRRAQVMLARTDAPAELQQRMDEVCADLDMLARLEHIRISKSEVEQERFATAEADPKYSQAFREFSIAVETLAPKEAAERIRVRSIRLELIAALDDWAALRRQIKPQDPSWRHLIAVAESADDDEPRNRLRRVWVANDVPGLEELAASTEFASQPATTVLLLSGILRRSGRIEQAVNLLSRAQRHYPNDFWINHDLAYCLMVMQPPRWNEALPYFVAALALRPDSPGVRVNLGGALVYKGDHEWQIALLDEAIRLKPDYATAWNNRGMVYYRLRQMDNALADFGKAVELKPDFTRAWFNHGIINGNLNRWKDAVGDYTQAVDLKADYAEAWTNRGNAHRMLGQSDKALADFTRAIEIRPDLAPARTGRGFLLGSLRHWDKAIPDFAELVKLQPGSAEAWTNRAYAYTNLHQWGKAAADYSKAIELSPRDWFLKQERGSAYGMLTQYKSATADFARAVELKPDNAQLWFYYAMSELGAGDLDGFRRVYARMRRQFGEAKDPVAATILLHTCISAQLGVDKSDFVRWGELAAKNSEDSRAAGYALYWDGHYKEAIRQLREWAETKPLRGDDLLFLAMAHYRLGKKDDAREFLAKAVEWIDGSDRFVAAGGLWYWSDQVKIRHLRIEAEILLQGK